MLRCSTCNARLLIRLGYLICTRPACPGHGHTTPPLKEAA